jgi:hypothetical protein
MLHVEPIVEILQIEGIVMDKLQINLPIEKDGKLFWVSGVWSGDGDVFTYVNTACSLDCKQLWDSDCLNCKYIDVETEAELLKKYEGSMYVAMKVLKDILEVK